LPKEIGMPMQGWPSRQPIMILEKWPIDFHKHASLRIITAVIHTRKRDVLIIHNCYAPNKKKSSKEFFEELSYLQAILMHLL